MGRLVVMLLLYLLHGKDDVDQTLDPSYVEIFRQKCKADDTTTTVDMVPGSSTTFDTDYYKRAIKNRGLLHSDAALLFDPQTKGYVYNQASCPAQFFSDFGVSMVGMERFGVLTGSDGEIRKNCAAVNP